MNKKKILFVTRHAPYGSSLAKEALDAILAASAYDQEIAILFMNDGVFQLLENQDTANISQKSFAAILPALEFYDITSVYVHDESLKLRNIHPSELAIKQIKLLNNKAVSNLFSTQDQLLGF